MSNIILQNWYQLDFEMQNCTENLLRVDEVIEMLRNKGLISKWFFLWERRTIRVRMESDNRAELEKEINKLSQEKGLRLDDKLTFSSYHEEDQYFFDEAIVEAFANIMSEVTKITVKKAKREIQFDNYIIMERLSHCIFLSFAWLSGKPESHFLIRRILEQVGMDRDFESRI